MSEQNGYHSVAVAELSEFDVKRVITGAEIAIATNDRPHVKVGTRKAAIVGFAPSSYREAPFAWNVIDHPEDGFELWGINELYKVPQVDPEKFSCWFDIHDRRDGDISQRDQENIKWMRAQKFPLGLYMQDAYPDIPSSRRFPVEKAIRFYRTTYFTNTISYMLALAGMAGRDENGVVIDEKEAYNEVHVYGVDMAQNDQNPGAQGEYCVGPETMVLTADLRHVRAGDVRVGDKIMAFDEHPGEGQYRRWRVATVETADMIKRPSYRVHLSDGTVLFSSQEHRWLVQMADGSLGWRETQHLMHVPNHPDRPSRLVRATDVWDEDTSFDAGYIAATFDGEGHLSQGPNRGANTRMLRTGFAQRPNAMRDAATAALLERGFDFRESPNGSVVNHTLRGGRPEIMRLLGSIRPRRLLSQLDVELLGQMVGMDHPEVVELEFVGEQDVIALKTSEGTFIADGFASHNSWQRPSCEYFIAYLRGLGIKVYVPPQSDLCFTPYLYGFQGDGQRFRKKLTQRVADLVERENGYKQQQQQYAMNAAATEGAAKAFANAAETLLKSAKISQQDHDELVKHSQATFVEANRLRDMAQQALFNAAQLSGARDSMSFVERAWTGTVETFTPDARLYEPTPKLEEMPKEALKT